MFSKFSPDNTPRMTITLMTALVMAISLMFTTSARADSPRFLNCPESVMTVNHCYIFAYNFDANQEGTIHSSRIRYELAETSLYGDFNFDPVSGFLHYFPSRVDVIVQNRYFSVRACHMSSGRCDTCTVYLDVTNSPPGLDAGLSYHKIEAGKTITVTSIVGHDPDFCDVLTYGLDPQCPGSIDPVTGFYTWQTDLDDAGLHNICVTVTDGFETAEDCFTIEVYKFEPYEVRIEKGEGILPGHYAEVGVTLNKGSEPMGGFDFLVGYNGAALAFTGAALSDELVECGWEYFTYRFNWNGDCGENCPSALVRFVGMAETNNGPYHPDWECISNITDLFSITFFVTNDPDECRFHPIRFYWVDCNDNAIVLGPHGDSLAINRHITDFDGNRIEDHGYGFPGYKGAPDDPCLNGDMYIPVRFADFINGGIDMVCADDLEPYEVQIETKTDVMQGHYIDVGVTLNKGSEPVGGFDFLIGYNTAALTFIEAQLSQQLVDCDWEYFTYRYGQLDDCDGIECPNGLVRLVGMAEINNGPYHPDWECIRDAGDILTMKFFVTNDHTWECKFVPLRFYWLACGDNVIATPSGDSLALNRYITDFDGTRIEDYVYGFPGFKGAPDDSCLNGDTYTPVRFTDLINGGIDIHCIDITDARGDINVNGLTHEIADWVMFFNYFLQGINAFGDHVEASIEASDVNCDGTSLRLEDLMKLAQVIVGNELPCTETTVPDTITADFMWDNYMKVVYVGSPYYKLSAVYMVFMGEIVPTLDLDMPRLNLAYSHDSGITRVIVYPDLMNDPPEFNMSRLFSFTGSGYPIEIQAADLDNHVVVTDYYSDADDGEAGLPTDYALHQNHPNPFNPSTEIRFSIPRVSEVTLEIFNVLGQKVTTLVDKRLSAGEHTVTWDGCDTNGKRVASGIYVYRLTAGEYSTSRQMVLSK